MSNSRVRVRAAWRQRRSQKMTLIFFPFNVYIKQLSDSVFVISRIIEVSRSVRVISLRPRLFCISQIPHPIIV